MDIDYDPTEDEADDVDGLLDYDKKRDRWLLICSEHGEVQRGPDGSAASHDEMVRYWPVHMQKHHHGDGTMTPDGHSMLIGSDG